MLNEVKSVFGGKTTLTIFTLLILNINLFSQWQLTNGLGTAYVNVIRNINDTLYAGTDYSAYRSTNNGDSWVQINNGLPTDPKVWGLSFTNSMLYAAINPEPRIYYSTNRGNQWLPTSNYPNTNSWSRNVTAANGYLFAGTDEYTYSSTNNGTNWVEMAVGQYYPYNTSCIIVKNSQVFAGDRGDGVAVSFLGGTSWTWVNNGLNNKFVYELSYNNDRLFAATRGGIFSTTNNGSNWVSLNPLLNSTYVYSLTTLNEYVFIGTQQNVYFSSNNGNDWQTITNGLPGSSPYIYVLAYNSTYLFAGLSSGAVYRRPLAELIGIQPISSEIPKQYSLSQNYPNPFNPVTNINFDVKERGFIKLAIFNSIGQEIATIVNEELSVGKYKADWNASNYPSGVYYYKITAGDFSETKKMVLVK